METNKGGRNLTVLFGSLLCAGKKRIWIPDEKEAYIEVEVKDLDGDKATVETKDGRVGK